MERLSCSLLPSTTLLAEYAHVLKVGGICYTVTDVKGGSHRGSYACVFPFAETDKLRRLPRTDLHDWMMHHLQLHPLFEYIPTEELLAAKDPVLLAAMTSTEEGIKVERNKGQKWAGCFRRIEDPLEKVTEVIDKPVTVKRVVRRAAREV